MAIVDTILNKSLVISGGDIPVEDMPTSWIKSELARLKQEIKVDKMIEY